MAETRPLGGGFGEEPVRIADLEAWAREAREAHTNARTGADAHAEDAENAHRGDLGSPNSAPRPRRS